MNRQKSEKTILITGSSSGIGKETALYFSEKGWNVIATMRNPSGRKPDFPSENIELLPLDVTDISSIRNAIKFTVEKYGRIDALVNNAGYAVEGIFEASTSGEAEKQFKTNVLGLMDAVREIIPVYREQKSGLIINVASIGGRIGFPFYSIYNSSKWAVEGFSDALHYELEPLNIKVKIIEPGLILTDFYNRSMVRAEKLQPYNIILERANKKSNDMMKTGSHPRVIAKLIYKAAMDKSNKLRYSGGSGAKIILLLRKILPDSLFFPILKSVII